MTSFMIRPTPGRIYRHRCGPVLKCECCSDEERYTATFRNVATGWLITGHNITMHPDGKIDWEYSTGGRFDKKEDIKND